jgi:hypothetical protein
MEGRVGDEPGGDALGSRASAQKSVREHQHFDFALRQRGLRTEHRHARGQCFGCEGPELAAKVVGLFVRRRADSGRTGRAAACELVWFELDKAQGYWARFLSILSDARLQKV